MFIASRLSLVLMVAMTLNSGWAAQAKLKPCSNPASNTLKPSD
jgi:hypothetical protein